MEAFMKHFVCALIVCFAFLVMANSVFAETDAGYEKALKYYNSGKYKEAVDLLKNYVQAKPEPSAYYRIGYALYKLRNFSEADEYFKMAYLIDPMFSPELHGLPELPALPEGKLKESAEPMHEQVPSNQMLSEGKQKKPLMKRKPVPGKQSPQESQPQKAQEPKATSSEKAPLPESPKVGPQGMIQPPAGFQPFPGKPKGMRGLPPGMPIGLVAGLGIMIYLIAFLLYIFFSLCLFLIAKKLNIENPWTAWIPLIQVWTFVSSAGKAWWWILLLLVPIVNTIVGVYLWICITENLGRNKWLGLLMLVPIVNFVFLGILAFSKTEQTDYTGVGTTTA
jgi:tetratricopeptide (TPR) repeat protein